MHDVTFRSLIEALPQSKLCVGSGSVLRIHGARPTVFVPPVLRSEADTPLGAAVVVVLAPAAVGKSTLAMALSADAQLPVLDLSTVPVGTGSLKAFITELTPDGGTAFQAGSVTLLIDALDEGRLLSGDAGFRAFFESAAPLVAGARGPRLVLLGRPESGRKVVEILRSTAPHLSVAVLNLGFFDEAGARAVIRRYADQEAQDAPNECKPYVTFGPQASEAVINEYFGAIERALALPSGELWQDEQGRALAGYAPVLAALGGLVARMENFQSVAQELRKEGRQEAWAVIEKVVQQILTREKNKQRKKLIENLGVSTLPAAVYDEAEQVALVVQHVLGQPLFGRGKIQFSDDRHKEAYRLMLEQQVPEHPFVHEGAFRNPVLGSIALASALQRGVLDEGAAEELLRVSRQPFLWRAFLPLGVEDSLFEGAHLGFLLESFWNDPVRERGRVAFRQDEDFVAVSVPGARGELRILPPVVLHGRVEETDLNSPASEVQLVGRSLRGNGSQLVLSGSVCVTCGTLDFRAQSLTIEGRVWLSADALGQTPDQIRLESDSQVGWGGVLRVRRPFREHPSTLDNPHSHDAPPPGLAGLLSECVRRGVPTALVLLADFGIPESHGSGPLLWMKNNYEETMRALLRLLAANGLVSKKSMQSRGADPKVIVHLGVSWNDLLAEYRQLSIERNSATPHREVVLTAMRLLD